MVQFFNWDTGRPLEQQQAAVYAAQRSSALIEPPPSSETNFWEAYLRESVALSMIFPY